MKLSFDVTLATGEELKIQAGVADFIAWERKTKKRISDLQDGAGMEDMVFLAWHAQKRQNPKTPEFDVWIESIDTLEAVNEDPKASRKVR